jgi:hypothetical protein
MADVRRSIAGHHPECPMVHASRSVDDECLCETLYKLDRMKDEIEEQDDYYKMTYDPDWGL